MSLAITAISALATEGENGADTVVFQVTRSGNMEEDVDFEFSLGNLDNSELEASDITSITYVDASGTAQAVTDIAGFIAGTQTLSITIPAGTDYTPTIVLTAADDDLIENTEAFTGNIRTSDQNVIITTSSADAAIIDEATIIVGSAENKTDDVTVNEGDEAIFFVTVKNAVAGSEMTLSFAEATTGDIATEFEDFGPLNSSGIYQYRMGNTSDWETFTEGDLITLVTGGNYLIQVKTTTEKDDRPEATENFTLTATLQYGTSSATVIAATAQGFIDDVTALPLSEDFIVNSNSSVTVIDFATDTDHTGTNDIVGAEVSDVETAAADMSVYLVSLPTAAKGKLYFDDNGTRTEVTLDMLQGAANARTFTANELEYEVNPNAPRTFDLGESQTNIAGNLDSWGTQVDADTRVLTLSNGGTITIQGNNAAGGNADLSMSAPDGNHIGGGLGIGDGGQIDSTDESIDLIINDSAAKTSKMVLTVDGLGPNYIQKDIANPTDLDSNDARVQLNVFDTTGNLIVLADVSVSVDGANNLYIHTDGSYWISNNESTADSLSRIVTVDLNNPNIEIGKISLGLVGVGSYEVRNLSADYGVTDSFDFVPVDGSGNVGADINDGKPSTVTIDTRFENQPTTVSVTSKTVSEEGLAFGITDGVGQPSDTTNDTTKMGTITINDPDSNNFDIVLIGPSGITAGGEPVLWDWDTSAKVLRGTTTAGVEVATITLGAQTGNGPIHEVPYTMLLKAAIDHPTNSAEDVKELDFKITVDDRSGSLSEADFKVNVEDDAPEATDSTQILSRDVNTNLMVMLDISSSMSNDLSLARDAIKNLVAGYDDLGNVRVNIILFDALAKKFTTGTEWIAGDDAALGGLIDDIRSGSGTNYDAGLSLAIDSFNDPGLTGKLADAQNVSYFISDGAPSRSDGVRGLLQNKADGGSNDNGIQGDADEIQQWKGFLDNNAINSFALSIGGGVDLSQLVPIGYNAITGEPNAPIEVDSINDLDGVLEGTVLSSNNGNLIEGNSASVGFGADTGYMQDVTIESVKYTYNPATETAAGVAIPAKITNNGGEPDTTGSILTVTSSVPATITINMLSGDYTYTFSPLASTGAIEEEIDFTLIDLDGDTASASTTLKIDAAPSLIVGQPLATNVMIMLDVSGSMDFKIDGVKIIETARAAIENMLDKYQENGPVKVKLGTFATDSRQLTEWVDVDTALRSLSELTPEGGTNYDAALVGIKTAFSNDSGKLENANNVSYFLSDGAPTLSSEYPDPGSGPGQNPGNVTNVNLGDGIFGQEISNWQTFVTDNNIKSYGVWIGDANDSQYLEPIAYDGVASSENPALVLTQPLDELLAALEDSVVTGQIFTGTAANNLIVSGLGDDLMTGNGGADSFIFDASTMNADALDADANTGGFDTDTITDFNDTADGDKLDLSDLLPDAANAGNLEQYLSFEKDASGTLIKVDANVSGTVDHVIKLENLDLTNDRNNSDTDIIKNLIDGNHLIID